MIWKVFFGVLGALVAFTVIVLVVMGSVESAAQEDLQQQVETYNRNAAADALAVRQRQFAARSNDIRARTLSPNQRCVGGTVVAVNGSTYTQAIGVDGRPVACSGRLAKSLLR